MPDAFWWAITSPLWLLGAALAFVIAVGVLVLIVGGAYTAIDGATSAWQRRAARKRLEQWGHAHKEET